MKPFAALTAAATIAFSSPVFAQSPVMELIDHIHGFKFVVVDDKVSFSPAGRHGVWLIRRGGSGALRLRKAFRQSDIDTAIAKRLERIGKKEHQEVLKQGNKGRVANALEARGFTWRDSKRNRSYVQLWFRKGDVLYELQCDAKDEHFDSARHFCAGALGRMEVLR